MIPPSQTVALVQSASGDLGEVGQRPDVGRKDQGLAPGVGPVVDRGTGRRPQSAVLCLWQGAALHDAGPAAAWGAHRRGTGSSAPSASCCGLPTRLEMTSASRTEPLLRSRHCEAPTKIPATAAPCPPRFLQPEVSAKQKELTDKVSRAFEKDDFEKAKELLTRMRYFPNAKEKIKLKKIPL